MTRPRRLVPSSVAALTAAVLALSLGLAAPTGAAPPSGGPDGRGAASGATDARVAAGPEARRKGRARAGGRLSYAPKRFVGGQALTFSGRLPVKGKRTIRLQQNMNRPGDQWFAVRGSSARTRANGSFRFQAPAPSMFGISYRVVGGGAKTRGVRLTARSQDLVLRAQQAGGGYDIRVDTTPSLRGRPDVKGTPVFRGRQLTLQRRNGSTYAWSTVARGRVGRTGNHIFSGQPAGVYRVRQEAITSGKNRIGWYPSFPTYVGRSVREGRAVAGGAGPEAFAPEAARASQTAGSRYRWGRPRFDFAWERSESLTSGPAVGKRRGFGWQDYSTDTGRVAQLNGGLSLESGRNRGGGPNVGTTSATLRGGYGQSVGRWETRLRSSVTQRSGKHYRVLVQLVPEGSQLGGCSSRAITIASLTPASSTMSFGVRKGSRKWTGSARITPIQRAVPALAVEVGRRHVTWFLNGRPIGTLRNRAAIPDGAKTLRIAMVGKRNRQMRQTFVVSDWQRSYSLGKRQVQRGKGLKTSRVSGDAC